MDFVPLEFCDSVCDALRYPELFDEFSEVACWKKAARKTVKSRVYVAVTLRFNNYSWSYNLESRGVSMTFDDLKNRDRRLIYVVRVELTDQRSEGFDEADEAESIYEEIMEIVTFTEPLINMANFVLHTTDRSRRFQEFAQILSCYKNASFKEICFHDMSNWMHEFMKHQLENGTVKDLAILNCGRRHHLPIVEEFLLTKSFGFARFSCWRHPFSEDFIQQLLAKPHSSGTSTLISHFTCSVDEMRSVNQSEQVVSGSDSPSSSVSQIVWKRQDGVLITAKQFESSRRISIQILKPN